VRAAAIALTILIPLTAACGMPRDPEDSFDRIRRGGVLRAGITDREPWTPAEAAVVDAFAQSLGARVEWHRASESALFEALETFDLDVAVGGFTADNPSAPRLGMTRPYVEADGRKHVIAVAPGENRLLFEFDRMLRAQAASIAARTGGKPLS